MAEALRCSAGTDKLLAGGFLVRGFNARVALGVFAAETLHATCRIDQFLLASEERMATGADFDVNVALVGRTRLKTSSAGALHADGVVLGVNPFLGHRRKPFVERTS